MTAPASPSLPLPGRVLFLSTDPDLVRRQLGGEDLSLAVGAPLRDEISTDEITPVPSLVVFDERLADHAHIGFKAGGEQPIGLGALKRGGFSVLVGGKRYGKGSSREHSPLAEQAAGIRLVIAESFERIYRQNADNVGLFTSTDFGLLDRLGAGEEIGIEGLLAWRDSIAAAVLRAGGLLAYGRAKLGTIIPATFGDAGRPRTLFEKILARHAIGTDDSAPATEAGQSGFVRADMRFIHDIYTGMCRHLLHRAFGDEGMRDPFRPGAGLQIAVVAQAVLGHEGPVGIRQRANVRQQMAVSRAQVRIGIMVLEHRTRHLGG